jgi:hypothetical protein
MTRKLLLIALLSFSLLFTYCKNTTVAPELKPGRRDYVWELDTLDMPVNYIGSMWGASPNDVWAVGPAGTENDRLLHYDGAKWSTYKKEPINCAANALFGFSADNVWMGGQAGWGSKGAGIWHYDGVKWSQNYVYDVEGSYDVQVYDIWGSGPNDIYASGVITFYDGKTDDFRGFLLHYDGRRWQEVVRVGPVNSQFLIIRKEQNRAYVHSFGSGGGSSAYETVTFYEVKGHELREIYSTSLADIYWASLNAVAGKVYFVIGKDAFRYLGGSLVKQFSFQYPQFDSGISGRNENDLFVTMKDGIAHYNGTDTEYLYKFPVDDMGQINVPMIFEKEVFFCIWNLTGPSYATNLILHGRLKE